MLPILYITPGRAKTHENDQTNCQFDFDPTFSVDDGDDVVCWDVFKTLTAMWPLPNLYL